MAPGFIDLQVNGFRGVDFTSRTLEPEAIARVETALRARGTVGYCPTVITTSIDTYAHCLPLLAAGESGPGRAANLGIHLEGPFLSPADGPRGVHPREWIAPPNPDLFDRLLDMAEGRIAIVTLAPEEPGGIDLIAHIRAASPGTVVAIGHSAATAEDIRQAAQAGARMATHVGNGMADQIHRHQNALWPLLADDRIVGAFITDGFHLPPELIRIALRAKGNRRFIVTSDLVHLAGLAAGSYQFHGVDVRLEANGRLHRSDAYQLAGSARDMLDCMNHLASLGELDEEALWDAGRWNALRLLGIEGSFADRASEQAVEFSDGVFRLSGS